MDEFELPCPLHNMHGEIRRVGVELEFHGMTLLQAAKAVREAFGGEIRRDSKHCFMVASPSFGDFEVTFDAAMLKRPDHEAEVESGSFGIIEATKGAAQAVMRQIGKAILPLEIGTPPIPMTQLAELTKLERALKKRHAKGTKASPFFAFALHFNPEAADASNPNCLINTLRSFMLLYEWLFREGQIDWTRRLLPFFDPFPQSYVRRVLDPNYAPDMAGFSRDYLAANPTRNRPLDMLPILAHNDPDVINRPELEGQKVKPRPTFHYRLPNSLLDDPEWSIAREWNLWVLIERLAANSDWLNELSRTYLDWENSISNYLNDRWVQYLRHEWVPLLRELPQEATC